ncbi:hypothetical protein [Herbidospora sp. NBRC 101105]|uniref:hypothetical protein n=1 Tax=Herbidospora sp. NBRC 101105 TaxID=3032195 RepID=UPI0024A060FD|nr:hypothetical protein [Herbidospora sp. NBRC 101105]GLX96815.1 hypothetical protein Hesp01_47650 [Herbidospora sp. NBRC 101105]
MLPELEADITAEELDREARGELKSLPGDLAELVAKHLVAATRALAAEDAEKAYEHAKVARRFAGRIGVVREAVGIAAYHAGQYAEALSDLRAARRMTGSEAFLPIMADCERGMGRPERALDLVKSKEAEKLDRAGKIELAIVESGARRDLGQLDAAVVTLQRLTELRDPQPREWSARLAFAYADALAAAGHASAAADWFGRAASFDEDGETDAAERYAELTGAVIEDIEEDEGDFDDDFADDASDDASDDDDLDEESPESASAEDDSDEDDDLDEESPENASAEEEDDFDDDEDLDEEPVEKQAAAPVKAGADKPAEEAGFGPAFIEPDYGDVLDGPADKPEA